MSGIYPNAVGAIDFAINDSVMHQVNSKEISRLIGRVIDIDQKANRVWVLFPVGPKESLDPSELIIATPLMGECLVPRVEVVNNSMVSRLAESITSSKLNMGVSEYNTMRLASKLAGNFLETKISDLCRDISASKKDHVSLQSTKDAMLSKHANKYTSEFIERAVEKIYQ